MFKYNWRLDCGSPKKKYRNCTIIRMNAREQHDTKEDKAHAVMY